MAPIRTSMRWIALLGALSFGALATSGCKTEAYCFNDCGDGGGTTATTTTTGSGTGGEGGDCLINCGEGGSGGTACVQTVPPDEVCDGVDNDCNDAIDDVDFNAAATCGTCTNNCYDQATHCEVAGTECAPSSDPGVTAGTCSCSQCATDYYDLDGDGLTCEYFCVPTAADDSVCDNKDNDCDGAIDEDVDFCTATNCGACGKTCAFIHATGQCANADPGCGPGPTSCGFICDCPDPTDAASCWWDANGIPNDGCELPCAQTNNGVEQCDGIDNDCDGLVDGADDLSSDPTIGGICFGDPDGVCGQVAQAGTFSCQAGIPKCTGANVVHENEILETCNLKDDDCDGLVDDFPIDAGGSCGAFSIFPCSLGTLQCQNGALNCVGAIGPQLETCNSVDDDCDGLIDSTGGMAPLDSQGACNVPPPAPLGATQPCAAGTKTCSGGSIGCTGSTGPTSAVDICGDDSNCDGSLDNQPNLTSDVTNCGFCGNDCYTGAVHAAWSCVGGACAFQGCQAGYFDLDGDQMCEYACTFVQAQETCNGADDNCDGQIDEGVVAPSPVQVCGVSPSATSPSCTSMVTVTCSAGAWVCGFPAGVCGPSCAGASEICDTLDNDCDGLVNENVPNYNQPCASDDAAPVPGDGACRTVGTYICNGNLATVCSAVKANCAALPAGCTETCDGIDNDCDGSTDEVYTAKGTNASFFVKPAVTRILSSAKWAMSYEATRPNATSTSAGTGNGYHSSAPLGTTLDKTKACSEPGKIPWFNVTPDEVEQTCVAVGGHICSSDLVTAQCGSGTGEWIRACTSPSLACSWSYNPSGAACTSAFSATKFCNLGNTYDFDPNAPGNQDGLLPTGSALLQNCWSDFGSSFFNTPTTNKVHSLTGNLREITKRSCPSVPGADEYPLMGGSFLTQNEEGAECDYGFYVVDSTYKFYDTGFRCCFDADPTL